MGGGRENDIHAAARNGDLVAVQTILSSNPLAVNSRDKHSRTPLHLAAWSGHNDIVSYLCKHKADMGASAMDDMGAIHFASQKGHLEVVRTLRTSGVSIKSVNRKGFTPLHYAAQGSHVELVKYLLAKGASLKGRTKSGKTPLDLAGNDEVQKVIEEFEQKPYETHKVLDASSPKPSVAEESVNSGDEQDLKPSVAEKSLNSGDEQENETVKRKDDGLEEASSRAKRVKVALSHLQSVDDTEEGEEDAP